MDNCFNLIQICRRQKSGVNRLKIGHSGQIWTLKLHNHSKESINLLLYEFSIKYDILMFLSKEFFEDRLQKE